MSVINYTVPHEFTSLSSRPWRDYQDKAGREWEEEMAEEEEHNRVMAMTLKDALDELFEEQDHEVRRLITDAIKDRLHHRWAMDRHALDEDRAASRAADYY